MENRKTVIDEKELEEAVRMADSADGVYETTQRFAETFEYEGRKYESLHFDWGKLTGYDGLAIENEVLTMGTAVVIPSLSGEYLVRMAARACTERIGTDMLLALPIREYNSIRSAARSFLLKTE